MPASSACTTLGSVLLVALSTMALRAAPPQTTPPNPPQMRSPQPPPAGPDPVEQLGKGLFRVGNVRVDTNRKEVAVAGTINDVSVLEFLANTKNGFKSYESAIEAETNAITFNVALILIGLDSAGVVHAPIDRGPAAPRGPEVDVLVQWDDGGRQRTVSAEELISIAPDDRPLPQAAWIYTGSVLAPERKALYADIDGVLIGFMHTRSSVIDHGGRLDQQYGQYRLNTKLLKPGTRITLIVRTRPTK